MMKKLYLFKRITTFLLSFIMSFNVFLFDWKVVSAETNGVQAKLDELRSVYYTGTYFTASGNAAYYESWESHINNIPARGGLPAGNTMGLDGTSCWAFAQYCFVYMFGHNFYSAQTVSSPSLGDAITLNNGAHYAIYLGEDSENYYVYDGNYDYYCVVRYNGTLSKKNWYISTVHHSQNYDQVYGTTTPDVNYATISAGDYYLRHKSTGKYLSVDGGGDANQQNISVANFTGGNEMKLAVSGATRGYIMRPHCSGSRIVNPYGTTVTSGMNVSLWPDENDSTQWWGFEEVSGGYIVRNMQNQNCVLAVDGTNVVTASYTGDANQIWVLESNAGFTVTYDANGGSYAPASQTKWYDVNLTLSSEIPTRTGYTFLGWGTSSSSTNVSYLPGEIYNGNQDITLYAVWELNPTVLSVNSSSDAVISTGGEIKYYAYTPSTSGTYVIYSTGSADTKVHLYNVSGTELDSNDDGGDNSNFRLEYNLTAGTKYIFGVKYYSSSTTGTIPFKFGNVYTINYNANGGTGAPASQKKDYGMSIALSSTLPTRSGYTFKGWATSSSATSATYQPGATYSSNSTITLYAVWELNPTVLSVNSSSNAVISTGGEIKYYVYTPSTSGTYVIYSTGSEDTKVHLYNASGTELNSNDDDGENWNFRLEYNLTAGTKYIFGVKYYNSSTTGTIPFKFGNVYTINYNANGGTGAPASQKKDYGMSIALSSTIPTRSGYTFKGWATSSSATSATYQPGATYSSNSTITLYAVWEKYWSFDSATGTLSIFGNGDMPTDKPWSSFSDEIKKVVISEGVTSIGDSAFSGCSSLTSITIPSSVTSICASGFGECNNLTGIWVDSDNLHYSSDETGVLFNKNKTMVIKCPGGMVGNYEISASVTSINEHAFSGCSSLTSITIPTSVTSIGNFAFGGCSSLMNITIPNSVTDMGWAYTFNGCSSLTSITIPNSVTDKQWTGTFKGCSSLTSITIPLGVTDIFFAFGGCSSLMNITIPNSVTYISEKAFFGCSSLTSITIPTGVTSIWELTFYKCSSLTSITIPSSVTRINWDAFTDCDNLQDVYFTGTEEDWKAISIDSDNESLFNATIHYNYVPVTMTNLQISTLPNKMFYEIGEDLDISGLSVVAVYSDGTEIEITEGFEINGFDSSTAGEKTITVLYGGFNASFTVMVNEVVDENAPQIVVSKAKSVAGKSVEVKISLKNNPGLASAKLKVSFDSEILILTGVKDEGKLGTQVHKPEFVSPYILTWANDTATENFAYDGVVVTLTFQVAQNAPEGVYPINVSYDYDNYDIIDCDMGKVKFSVVNGNIEIVDVMLGDVNADGIINTLDRVLLTRYLASWDGYSDEEVNLYAADVNKDGIVNTLDRVILTRHLAAWGGYEALPYVA